MTAAHRWLSDRPVFEGARNAGPWPAAGNSPTPAAGHTQTPAAKDTTMPATVLDAPVQGIQADVIATYLRIIDQATAGPGIDHEAVLHARAALAHHRHALGDCDTALRDMVDVYSTAVRRDGRGSRLSLRILVDLGGLYRACGWYDLARRCLATVHTSLTYYLPPGDDLHHDLGVLALAPTNHHRAVCTQHPART